MISNGLCSCGCCEGISAETPVKIYNRPGLTEIKYRAGDFAGFREHLLSRLSAADLPALQRFTTRGSDDFTIALLDAWSVAGEVLTFYQERIANEAYLGTATELFSIQQLARLIGYELRPGVAAGVYLAFTMEMVPGQLLLSPTEKSQAVIPPVTIAAGTKVQSTPGPGETAQTFETIENIEARPEWNAMQARLTQPQLAISKTSIIEVQGADSGLKAGDVLLIENEGGQSLSKILKVHLDTEKNTTQVYLDEQAVWPAYTESTIVVNGNQSDYPEKVVFNNDILSGLLSKTWNSEDLTALIEIQGWSANEITEGFRQATAAKTNSGLVSVFQTKASVFGYNAPKQVTYNGSIPKKPSLWDEWDLEEEEGKIYLDVANDQILPGTAIAVQNPTEKIEQSKVYTVVEADVRSRTEYGISSKTTEISITPNNQWWAGANANLGKIRPVTIHANPKTLPLTGLQIDMAVEGDTVTLFQYYPGLKKGLMVMVTGERADLKGTYNHEIKALKGAYISGGQTVLVFDTPLEWSYIRKTLTINANVAAATHGESVKEVLGSGNASEIFQKFTLKQNPVTYIGSTSASGATSTLEIRVNNILWYEVPSFFERGPLEQVYITRRDEEGKTTVIFGDGIQGARLPTGQENVRASYRKGIGSAGNVKANQLSQLMSRPLGLKSATNPLAASGAQDSEAPEDARTNAGLTIFTLGRIVTLQDYEDFARAFAGISKALARWVWLGQKRMVCLTVAGTQGAAVENSSLLYGNLLNAIGEAGIPGVPVSLLSYQARYFKVKANVLVQDNYLPDVVLKEVELALRDAFSFSKRLFGQAVSLSEVIAVMQLVEGVAAVDVDEFYRSDGLPELKDKLFAAVPQPGTEGVFAAELLTIDSSPISIGVML